MSEIYWWPLTESLVETMNQEVDKEGNIVFKGIEVYAGTKQAGKKYPCIEVTWDNESGISIHRPIQGEVVLWIDIALKTNSSKPSEHYELMYPLQLKVFKVLGKWNSVIKQKLQISPIIEVTDVISDGDIQRPTCVCRIVTNIKWRNSI